MWASRYWCARYWAQRYWPKESTFGAAAEDTFPIIIGGGISVGVGQILGIWDEELT